MEGIAKTRRPVLEVHIQDDVPSVLWRFKEALGDRRSLQHMRRGCQVCPALHHQGNDRSVSFPLRLCNYMSKAYRSPVELRIVLELIVRPNEFVSVALRTSS